MSNLNELYLLYVMCRRPECMGYVRKFSVRRRAGMRVMKLPSQVYVNICILQISGNATLSFYGNERQAERFK